MKYEVVDTNVLVVAEGKRTGAGALCQKRAAEKPVSVQNNRSLVVDTSMEILRKYQRALTRHEGEPGPSQHFYVWVASSGDHKLVQLHPHPQRGFEAFPADPRLETFDRDDRKFVAAAIASGRNETQVVNAVDSDYSLHRAAFEEAGVSIQELCPEELTQGPEGDSRQRGTFLGTLTAFEALLERL